jgi:hypothetical protein
MCALTWILRKIGMGTLLIVVALSAIHSAVADPNSAVRFLMQEPISMLDWGFKNIEDHLLRNGAVLTEHEKRLFQAEPSISVAYDWSIDVIRISIGMRLSENVQKTTEVLEAVKERVSFVIVYVRGLLTMNPYDAYFRHKGFRNKETPDDLEQKLSAGTEIVVTVRDKDSNILCMCKGSLLGLNMTWMKIGEK